MRRSRSQFLVPASLDFSLVGLEAPALREEQKQELAFGAGGFLLGGLVGLLFASRFTFHSPVRRRR